MKNLTFLGLLLLLDAGCRSDTAFGPGVTGDGPGGGDGGSAAMSWDAQRCDVEARLAVHKLSYQSGAPRLAALAGEYAAAIRTLNGGVEVERFASDPLLLEPRTTLQIADERGSLWDFVGLDEGYALLSQELSAGAQYSLRRRTGIGGTPSSRTWERMGRLLSARLTAEGSLLAVPTDPQEAEPTAFQVVNRAGDSPESSGAPIREARSISFMRLHPAASAVSYIVGSSGPRAPIWRILPSGGASDVPACKPAMVVAVDFHHDVAARGNDLYAVRDCPEAIYLARLDRAGKLIVQVTIATAKQGIPSRLAVDPAGRIGVASWNEGGTGPVLRLFEPTTLTEIRAPIPVDKLEGCGGPGDVQLVVEPGTAGRWALLYSAAIGHGTGCAQSARIEACR